MTQMTVEVRGLEEVERKFAGAPKVINEEFQAGMKAAVIHVQGEVRRLSPADRGDFRRSVAWKVEGLGSDVVGTVGSNLKFGTYSAAEILEYGSRPHWPPVEALRTWAERHGRTAWGVALSIATKGTPAFKMFQKGMEASVGKVQTLFNQAINRIVSRLS